MEDFGEDNIILLAKDYLDAERKRLAVKSLNDGTKSF